MKKLLILLVMVFLVGGCNEERKPEKTEEQVKVEVKKDENRRSPVEVEKDEMRSSPYDEQSYLSNNHVKWTVQGVWNSMGIRAPSEVDITVKHKMYKRESCCALVDIRGVEYLFVFVWKDGKWKYAAYEMM